MKLLFLCSLILIVYVYFGYPLLLIVLAMIKKKPVKRGEFYPTVSLLVAAYNEEKVIREKIENSLSLDYPKDKLKIVIISDGSEDKTDEIVREYEKDGVVLKRYGQRMGKMGVLNRMMQEVISEVVVFSDANTMYQEDAIKKLLRNLYDPSVGAVTGDVKLASQKVSFGEGEGLYYKYERFIQLKESEIGSIVGVDGAMYAIRRELYLPPSDNIILDDFVTSMNIGVQGWRVIYDPEALAFEETSPTWQDELKRRPRITAGGYQALWQREGVPGIKNGFFLVQYLSHRLFRWLLPFFLISLFVSNALILEPLFFKLFFASQIIFYSLAVIGLATESKAKPVAVPFYFCLVNYGALLGAFRWLAKTQMVTWTKGR